RRGRVGGGLVGGLLGGAHELVLSLWARDAGGRCSAAARSRRSGLVAASKQQQEHTHAVTVTPVPLWSAAPSIGRRPAGSGAVVQGGGHGFRDEAGPAQKPRRPSCLGSRCQSLATLTRRSRCTLRSSRRLISVRAREPTSFRRDPPRPMMMPFWL